MPKKFASVEERRAYGRHLYAASNGKYKKRILRKKKIHIQKSCQFVWDYLKEHPCMDCGEDDPIVLEFDHVSNKFKAISEMLRCNYSIARIVEEIEKCEVRCANCHRRKTVEQLGHYQHIKR